MVGLVVGGIGAFLVLLVCCLILAVRIEKLEDWKRQEEARRARSRLTEIGEGRGRNE